MNKIFEIPQCNIYFIFNNLHSSKQIILTDQISLAQKRELDITVRSRKYSRLVAEGSGRQVVTGRRPVCPDTCEQWLLVLLDAPHVGKVFREPEANGVGEEVAEGSSEAGEDAVGDEGG